MLKIGQIANKIFDEFTSALNFLLTIPGLLITSAVGIVTSCVQAIQFLTGEGWLQGSVISYVETAFYGSSSQMQTAMAGNELLSTVLYCVNADGFVKCIIQLPIWLAGITLFLLTFIVDVAMPVVIGFLVWKVFYKILTAILPKGWAPNVNIDVPNYEEFSIDKGNLEVF